MISVKRVQVKRVCGKKACAVKKRVGQASPVKYFQYEHKAEASMFAWKLASSLGIADRHGPSVCKCGEPLHCRRAHKQTRQAKL